MAKRRRAQQRTGRLLPCAFRRAGVDDAEPRRFLEEFTQVKRLFLLFRAME